MKIKPYLEKLNNSKEFKEFKNKYKDAFLTAGFFVLDLEAGKNLHQIDYYVPSEKKIAAFTLDGPVAVQLLETMAGAKAPEKLDIKTNIDLDAIAGILHDEMRNRSISEDLKKIIAVIQNIDGKKIWNLNCVLSGMEILRAHVEDESKTVLKMDRASVFEYIQKISPDALKAKAGKLNGKDNKKEIDKLNELEKQIEKKKEEIQKQINKQLTSMKNDKKEEPVKTKVKVEKKSK